MIQADLHLHTCYSHGKNTPFEMHAAACQKGLAYIGFSEHSPRPEGYNYTHEYREQLKAHLQDYISQVGYLKQNPGQCRTLYAMEIDWLPAEMDFMKEECDRDFDYLIGSVHFLGTWGFDDGKEPWENASQEQCESWYEQYFHNWREMINSGLFQIAAHPDLIKIYSVERFHIWLDKPQSRELVNSCLKALRDKGMAMEISSAGLRKVCGEIYPCPLIMQMAAANNVEISLASDAHNTNDIAADFPRLMTYGHAFGFNRQAIFENGKRFTLRF